MTFDPNKRESRELADTFAELIAALEEARVCLTTTFRDTGRRHDAAIKQVEAALAKARRDSINIPQKLWVNVYKTTRCDEYWVGTPHMDREEADVAACGQNRIACISFTEGEGL